MSDLRRPSSQLLRVPAREVRVGDRMGEGRSQGVQIVEVKMVPWDTEPWWFLLGSHGWASFAYTATVLVERQESR